MHLHEFNVPNMITNFGKYIGIIIIVDCHTYLTQMYVFDNE